MPKTFSELRKSYLKAMNAVHPDKGGTAEQAAKVIESFEKLKARFEK
jgi:hypothetical protein